MSRSPKAGRWLQTAAPSDASSTEAEGYARLVRGRLRWLVLCVVVLGALGSVVAVYRPQGGPDSARPVSLAVVWVVLALGLGALLLSRRVPMRVQLGASVAFLVASSLVAALYRHWLPYEPLVVLRGFSPIVLYTVFFAVLVPVTPRQMAIGAFASAAMDPGALLATVALLDRPSPPPHLWFWLSVQGFVAAPVAVAVSHQLFRLRLEVRRAKKLGAYRLVERLGVGGMGEVWRAEHRSLARPAAVKVIRPASLGVLDAQKAARLRERFAREAHATASLRSPHTIEVYDFGSDEEGSFYYVMELLDGLDLQAFVKRHGPLAIPRAAHLLQQVCHSLSEAHGAGMVHRDIKPANLFLCRRGEDRDVVKVLDFGLVKLTVDDAAPTLTREGGLIGSPGYIAPELLHGKPATAASDLYSLGCVATFLLTGERVFEAAEAPFGVLLAHLQQPVPPLQRRRPEVPDGFARLVERMLEREPEKRPQSAAAVAAALRAHGGARAWTQAEARRWWATFED